MKLGMVVVAVCIGAAGTLGASRLVTPAAQPDKKAPAAQPGKDAAPPDMDAVMQEMMKFATPGEEHAMLAEMVGTWDCECKFFMPGPDGKVEEMASKGECTFTSELGGRWIRQDFSTDFMGEKFNGMGMTGYDKFKKEYVATWMDTMSTMMISMRGSYDKATKTMTLTGTYELPGMGTVKSRHVGVHKDADTHVYSMYAATGGQPEVKEGEITYRRRK